MIAAAQHKLLIANRGEIACRIIRTAKELQIPTVAVYSEADKHAMHVKMADEAVAVGPAPARESYLRIDALLEVARQTGATAVHPGYGFLAESAEFAQAVMSAGLAWVGPAAQSITDMGDKERARKMAKQAGLPVLPGSSRFYPGETAGLVRAGQEIGYPLLVKAAGGGGGIGMQMVENPEDLLAVVSATQSMAEKAFNNAGVYLERLVRTARHIEVQVFGFGNGVAVHLYDRECSIQRRFQKVLEEAPVPNLSDEVRKTLHSSAIALTQAQNYSGAGTVEFIYDCDRQEAYFLEMNTRIQVEHPITEAITGIDIVKWQILHALNHLPIQHQEDIPLHGHAVEVRLYAERPDKNFLPSPGVINALTWPASVDGLRIDTGVRVGDRITPFYDPMIAKFIAHKDNRDDAIDLLTRAIEQLVIDGLHTNAYFLHELLQDPSYRAFKINTNFIGEYFMKRGDKT
ncbi:acetyl-CoA carboxylase biotin carboxylase subunit [Alcaligenes endophyticus]|uniref:Acetyl-CoA carboxylase biotin carboxylase subunit n=1 Tax=Alcaligenes endophyticus TaxID=1929088 RepID=A0ABT8EFJ5_9BURK|nr:biotin carboxylase N-terminal domain-containing protein [Alcaligenes endophyticus]MCX5590391.1 acetyl-CoA carboxylase biotin carboxylase subunit [Alcaligenes endophyticus]MDN4119945.1 acetyl-CoA carboxylase biotin carboxylase subunit [Alcaligenes endophyticus]